MAKDKECLVCGKKYKYCPHCNKNGVVDTWKNTYCSKECRTIFNTCSNYVGNIITKEEAYNIMSGLNINMDTISKSVKSTVEDIMTYKPVIKNEEEVEQPKRKPRRRRKKIEE